MILKNCWLKFCLLLLQTNMKTRGKVYQCTQCGLRAEKMRAINHVLAQHVHFELRPFHCKLCKKGMVSSNRLSRHLKSAEHKNSEERAGVTSVDHNLWVVRQPDPYQVTVCSWPDETADLSVWSAADSEVYWYSRNQVVTPQANMELVPVVPSGTMATCTVSKYPAQAESVDPETYPMDLLNMPVLEPDMPDVAGLAGTPIEEAMMPLLSLFSPGTPLQDEAEVPHSSLYEPGWLTSLDTPPVIPDWESSEVLPVPEPGQEITLMETGTALSKEQTITDSGEMYVEHVPAQEPGQVQPVPPFSSEQVDETPKEPPPTSVDQDVTLKIIEESSVEVDDLDEGAFVPQYTSSCCDSPPTEVVETDPLAGLSVHLVPLMGRLVREAAVKVLEAIESRKSSVNNGPLWRKMSGGILDLNTKIAGMASADRKSLAWEEKSFRELQKIRVGQEEVYREMVKMNAQISLGNQAVTSTCEDMKEAIRSMTVERSATRRRRSPSPRRSSPPRRGPVSRGRRRSRSSSPPYPQRARLL